MNDRPRHAKYFILRCVAASIFIGACSAKTTPSPSPIPTTALPPTVTPSVTPTSTLTPTITIKPDPSLEDIQMVEAAPLAYAGFSFVPFPLYSIEYAPEMVMISNEDYTIMLTIGVTSIKPGLTLEDRLNSLVEDMGRDIDEFVTSSANESTIAGTRALSTDMSGLLFGDPFSGQITILDAG